MTRLPLTVIGGYLGAGKTTLINRLLTGDHGQRLMVMVNDFGAVNIDADLLSSADEDTIELTNGCVCCTMGADLFMAVGDVLDRKSRPDHLIIEASGIADPARIAEVARTEPDLSYAGIVTLVDGLNFLDLLQDSQIAPQLRSQVDVADLIIVSKAEMSPELTQTLNHPRILPQDADMTQILWDTTAQHRTITTALHAHFTKWSHQSTAQLDRQHLEACLRGRPAGLYRLKGFIACETGHHIVQVVGKQVEITFDDTAKSTEIVAIAPVGAVTRDAIDAWWTEHTKQALK